MKKFAIVFYLTVSVFAAERKYTNKLAKRGDIDLDVFGNRWAYGGAFARRFAVENLGLDGAQGSVKGERFDSGEIARSQGYEETIAIMGGPFRSMYDLAEWNLKWQPRYHGDDTFDRSSHFPRSNFGREERTLPYGSQKKAPRSRRPIPVVQPYPVPVVRRVPYPVETPVPYPVEKKVEVPVPYPVERVVAYPVAVPVARPYPVPVLRPYPVHVDRPVPYPVQKIVHHPIRVPVPVPQPYAVHVRVPVLVERIVRVPVPVYKQVPRDVVREVPVPFRVPVDRPVHIHVPDVAVPVDRVDPPPDAPPRAATARNPSKPYRLDARSF